jgi:hypothetical protein
MSSSEKNITKSKTPSFYLTLTFYVLGSIGLLFTIYILYRISISDRKLFSVGLLPLFAGLLFESFRVSDKWKTLVNIFIGTYFFSLITFLPGKHEYHYDFENHIENWPYAFIIFLH